MWIFLSEGRRVLRFIIVSQNRCLPLPNASRRLSLIRANKRISFFRSSVRKAADNLFLFIMHSVPIILFFFYPKSVPIEESIGKIKSSENIGAEPNPRLSQDWFDCRNQEVEQFQRSVFGRSINKTVASVLFVIHNDYTAKNAFFHFSSFCFVSRLSTYLLSILRMQSSHKSSTPSPLQ